MEDEELFALTESGQLRIFFFVRYRDTFLKVKTGKGGGVMLEKG